MVLIIDHQSAVDLYKRTTKDFIIIYRKTLLSLGS
jgi:hypothetical protein